MTKFVVTTNVKVNNTLIEKAKNIAENLEVKYIVRRKLTIKELVEKYGAVMVVYSNKIVYFNEQQEKLFFHLDTAMVRIKNNSEPLVEIIGAGNKTVLDLTMGLARDSVVLSYCGYEVTAVEKNSIIYTIVRDGLANYDTGKSEINAALRKITTHNEDNYQFLTKCKDKSYDIIYLDPMFNRKIKDSNNLQPLENLASRDILTTELFAEIKRVAKKKIIVKAHNSDEVFEKFDFKKLERAGAKFSFGLFEIGGFR